MRENHEESFGHEKVIVATVVDESASEQEDTDIFYPDDVGDRYVAEQVRFALSKVRDELVNRANSKKYKWFSKASRRTMARYAGKFIVAEGYMGRMIGKELHPFTNVKIYDTIEQLFADYKERRDLSKIFVYQVGKKPIRSLVDIFVDKIEKDHKMLHQPQTPAQAYTTTPKTSHVGGRYQPVVQPLEKRVLTPSR